jgi:glycosyltransferase involved in cell wall biosynthesis
MSSGEPGGETSATVDAQRVAVIIPCLNEALTVAKVIEDFRRVLPRAEIYVIDNGSTDRTAEIAAAGGAQVLFETRRGKGFAVRSGFRRIDADFYVLVDGDDTYPAESVLALFEPVLAGRADMAVGSRNMAGNSSQFRPMNRLGNRLIATFLRFLLRVRLTDILSGFRVMTRHFVQSVPITARDFEIEAELTIKAVERSFRLVEVPINLRARPLGSLSKLRRVRDGRRISWTILLLFRDYRPMAFFGGSGLGVMLMGLIPGFAVISEFVRTGLVPNFPSAILAVALELAGMLAIAVGLVLSAVSRRFQELEAKMEMLARPPARRSSASSEPDPLERRRHGRA